MALLAAACSSSSGSIASADDLAAEIISACEATSELHNMIVAEANAMSAAEVIATPEERANLLADGLNAMIQIVAEANLIQGPAELVVGLRDRRDLVVRDVREEAAMLKQDWPVVPGEDRGEVVAQIFILGEKLMSETEPRITPDSSADLIEAIRAIPECRHVIQLPRSS